MVQSASRTVFIGFFVVANLQHPWRRAAKARFGRTLLRDCGAWRAKECCKCATLLGMKSRMEDGSRPKPRLEDRKYQLELSKYQVSERGVACGLGKAWGFVPIFA